MGAESRELRKPKTLKIITNEKRTSSHFRNWKNIIFRIAALGFRYFENSRGKTVLY